MNSTTLQVNRPALRWHGGKMGKAGRLADWILSFVPPHECYVEPFGGGGSVLLRKARSTNEVYNDLFDEVVTFFRVLRDREDELVRVVRLTPFAEVEHAAAFEPVCDDLETARRLAVRSWMSFGYDAAANYRNSGFRSGTKAAARDSGMDWRHLPLALHKAARRLQGVHIYNRPYEWVLAKYDGSATCFYIDPPYLHETRSAAHRDAYTHEMGTDDHAELLERLCSLKGMVLLSGYDSPLYRANLGGWEWQERRTFANGSVGRTEVLWMNPAAVRHQRQKNLFAA